MRLQEHTQSKVLSSSDADKKIQRPSIPTAGPGKASGDRNRKNKVSDAVIPGPETLAKSFLDQEPQPEAAKLEAELLASSASLQQSTSSSETEDNGRGYGTGGNGNGILSGFLAGFFAGVADRLELTVSNVQVTLGLKIDSSGGASDSTMRAKRASLVNLILGIEHVDVEGVTAMHQSRDGPNVHIDTGQSFKIGKRLITLKGVQCRLDCDHAMFDSLFPQSKKASKTQSSSINTLSNGFGSGMASKISEATEEPPETPTGDQFHTAPQDDDAMAFSPSMEEFQSHFQPSYSSIDPGHMADVETEGSTGSSDGAGYGTHPWRHGGSLYHARGSHGNMQSALQSFRRERGPLTQERLRRRKSPISNSSTDEPANSRSGDENELKAPMFLTPEARLIDLQAESDRGSRAITPPEGNEMTESKFFSHDEAESLYVSVVDHNDNGSGENSVTRGAWNRTQPISLGSNISRQEFNSLRTNKADSPFDRNPKDTLHNDQHCGRNPAQGDIHSRESLIVEHTTSAQEKTGHDPEAEQELPDDAPNELSLDLFEATSLQLWLPGLTPQLGEDTNKPRPEREKSNSGDPPPSMPGAFSIYAESAASSRGHINDSKLVVPTHSSHPTDSSPHGRSGTDIEVEVEALSSLMSLQTCSLALQLMRKIQAVVLMRYSEKSHSTVKSSSPKSSKIQVRLSIREAKIALTHGAEESKSGPGFEKSDNSTSPEFFETLMQLHIQDLLFELQADNGSQTADLDFARVAVDGGGQRLMHFDQSATLRTSIKDTQILNGKDISLHFHQESGFPNLNITTMPLVIDLDATKLDETLDCVGGVSALFEIRSSVLTDHTTPEASLKEASPTKRPRVRFEAKPQHPSLAQQSSSTAQMLKINARVSGSSISLRAANQICTLQSSAIKVVVRSEGVGAQVDEVKIQSPRHYHNNRGAASQIHINNLGVKFLQTPEEQDLTRLISIVTPTKDNFEQGDGNLIVETMLRQRKNGTALRITISNVLVDIVDVAVVDESKSYLSNLGRLGSITKYLPEESRPGTLVSAQIDHVEVKAKYLPALGRLECEADKLEIVNVSAPSLLALRTKTLLLTRNINQKMIHPLLPQDQSGHDVMFMARLVGEDIIPTLEVQLMNTCLEYDVSILMECMDTETSPRGVDALGASVAALPPKDPNSFDDRQKKGSLVSSGSSSTVFSNFKLDLAIKDCSIGLTPRQLPSKGQLVLTNARFQGKPLGHDTINFNVNIRKATLLLIDERVLLLSQPRNETAVKFQTEQHIPYLCKQGYVTVGWISAAQLRVNSYIGKIQEGRVIDVEFDDELLVLESCADSTQTLSALFSALQPPPPPVEKLKYRTEIATVQDMMASFIGDDPSIDQKHENPVRVDDTDVNADMHSLNLSSDIDQIEHNPDLFIDSSRDSSNRSSILDLSQEFNINGLSDNQSEQDNERSGDVHILPTLLPEDFYAAGAKWDSDRNRYAPLSHSEVVTSPFKLKITNMHIIWNLHDGYDWKKTRDTISYAVHNMEVKTEEKRNRHRQRYDDEHEQEPVIEDFLFNSIYVGVPVNHDPRELTRQINREVDDLISETASNATATTDATSRANRPSRLKPKKLKLERSQRHKITFELSGVSADMFIFPPGQETVSSTDVRIRDFEIFDHVPSSTWKKFATYMRDAGPREDKKPMMHLEICNVKPIPDLLASELVMRVSCFDTFFIMKCKADKKRSPSSPYAFT